MELRSGSQHCQNGILCQMIDLCTKITDQPLLFRLDSGNDAAENVGIMLNKGVYYVVKRNLRKEDRDEWASNIRSWCKKITTPREGKKVYVGSTFKDIHYSSQSGEDSIIRNRIVYEMIERTSKADGQLLLIPDVEIKRKCSCKTSCFKKTGSYCHSKPYPFCRSCYSARKTITSFYQPI